MQTYIGNVIQKQSKCTVAQLSFRARDKQKQRVCFAVLNLYVSITLMLIVKSYSLLHLCPKPLMMASRSTGIIEESAGQAIISDFHFLLVFGL